MYMCIYTCIWHHEYTSCICYLMMSESRVPFPCSAPKGFFPTCNLFFPDQSINLPLSWSDQLIDLQAEPPHASNFNGCCSFQDVLDSILSIISTCHGSRWRSKPHTDLLFDWLVGTSIARACTHPRSLSSAAAGASPLETSLSTITHCPTADPLSSTDTTVSREVNFWIFYFNQRLDVSFYWRNRFGMIIFFFC